MAWRKAVQLALRESHWRYASAGYGSYGPPPGWGHGARVILLKAGQPAHEAETWIRLENGARVDQSKNPKYGLAKQTVCEAGTLTYALTQLRALHS